MKISALRLVVVLLTGSLLSAPAQRGDPPASGYNLEPGFPTDLIDAYAREPKRLSAETFLRWEQTDDDEDRFLFRPKIAYGIAPFAHIEASTTVFAGDADRTGSGDLRIGGHYQFLDENGWVPALGIFAAGDLPTGKDTRGLDTTVTLAASRELPMSANDRLHANLSYLRNAGREDGEREHYYRVAFGYSREFGDNLSFVADFIREEQRARRSEANIVEAGTLYQFDDRMALSISAGFGIGDESPDFRFGTGFRWNF